MVKTIHIFSGLGADHRVFQKMDFGKNDVIYIPWLAPLKKESIDEYAKRIAKSITHNEPILIGLSFGGIVAMEVVKHIKVQKLILFSSAKTKAEIPFLYRFFGALRVHKLIPAYFMKRSSFISNWLFGTTSAFEKNLLKQILNDTDGYFLKWAMTQVVHWKNNAIPKNLTHIHGDSDRILPVKNVRADFIIKGGGHFLVLNKASELSALLKTLL